VVQGIRAGDLHIITHPEVWPVVEQRQNAVAAAFERAEAQQ